MAQPRVTSKVPLIKFFYGITALDRVLLITGTVSAVIAGLILPSIALFMGNIAVVFSDSK